MKSSEKVKIGQGQRKPPSQEKGVILLGREVLWDSKSNCTKKVKLLSTLLLIIYL